MGLFSAKDNLKDYTDEELEEMEKKVHEHDFTRKDMVAMFIAAMTTFLPPILLIIFAIWLLVRLML